MVFFLFSFVNQNQEASQRKSQPLSLMIKKILFSILGLFLILVVVLLFNTVTSSSKQIKVDPVTPIVVGDEVLDNFSKAVQIPTISYNLETEPDSAVFIRFRNFLQETYPLIDSVLNRKIINKYSLLYTWEGTDPKLKPIILMSHQDVVPIDEPTKDKWQEPPFSGAIKEGVLWGRGSLDDKSSLIGIMEAVERLIAEGYKPSRTIYLAFGHDEELGGHDGALEISKYLASQNVQALFTIDEGGLIVEGLVPGLSKPMAMVNVAEKGFVSYELAIETGGGHSSNPPAKNTIGMLAKAIYDLEQNQLDFKMVSPLDQQIAYLGPELPFGMKLVFSNPWLFKNLILEGFTARTTTAPTIFNSGIKDNVIPTVAKATVNFRILPGETSETVKQHIIDVVDNDQITIKVVSDINEPSPVSEVDVEGFRIIEKTIKQLYPEAVVVPGLIGGGTDSKHFYAISDNVYRFYPWHFSKVDEGGAHGINERIKTDYLKECVQFVHQLIKNANP